VIKAVLDLARTRSCRLKTTGPRKLLLLRARLLVSTTMAAAAAAVLAWPEVLPCPL